MILQLKLARDISSPLHDSPNNFIEIKLHHSYEFLQANTDKLIRN